MIRSAMMTTTFPLDNSYRPIFLNENLKPANALAIGACHVDPERAKNPRLVYDLGVQDYINFLCTMNYTETQIKKFMPEPSSCSKFGGGVRDLNYLSFVAIFDAETKERMLTRTLTKVSELLEMNSLPSQRMGRDYNLNETDTSMSMSSLSPRRQDTDHDDGKKKISNAVKKSSQHAYERDRREKLNKLYSSLRELLPKDKRKKLSIPCTIARVLKYIPELQKCVERLKSSREELLLRASNDEFDSNCDKGMMNPVISAICLSKREIMIQICIFNTSSMITFSKIIKILEREELQLLNATTHTTHDDKTLYSLHLQAKKAMRIMEKEIFCEKLMNSVNEQTMCTKTVL
ncbi:uncharacterized protein A4U43_C07F16320 [Asparagus officinalis]|uniref:BHLH domain-containing protein n=1 Tax=Asparagus officinalis TaxID=4686 RepID=A0A5P1ECL1_ASPOF|nr:uncharacterized protein A4U43_C07F16320 [Asparagus officinalis]